MFGTTIDCSSAVLGDYFQVLSKNKHLYEIFAVKRSLSKYEKQLSKFVNFYKDKSISEIKQKILSNPNKLMQLELEIIKDENNK